MCICGVQMTPHWRMLYFVLFPAGAAGVVGGCWAHRLTGMFACGTCCQGGVGAGSAFLLPSSKYSLILAAGKQCGVRMLVCNTFTPKIKGIRGVACLMSPWLGGSIFDVALVRGQHRDVALALQRLC